METKVPKGIYQHYKGNRYEVLDIARHSETLEKIVIYRSLYDDFQVWVRPLKMFLEDVEIEGIKVKRFHLIQANCRAEN